MKILMLPIFLMVAVSSISCNRPNPRPVAVRSPSQVAVRSPSPFLPPPPTLRDPYCLNCGKPLPLPKELIDYYEKNKTCHLLLQTEDVYRFDCSKQYSLDMIIKEFYTCEKIRVYVYDVYYILEWRCRNDNNLLSTTTTTTQKPTVPVEYDPTNKPNCKLIYASPVLYGTIYQKKVYSCERVKYGIHYQQNYSCDFLNDVRLGIHSHLCKEMDPEKTTTTTTTTTPSPTPDLIDPPSSPDCVLQGVINDGKPVKDVIYLCKSYKYHPVTNHVTHDYDLYTCHYYRNYLHVYSNYYCEKEVISPLKNNSKRR